MNKATFRANFPEFANLTTFPDTLLDFWSGVGESLLPQDTWGTTWVFAVQLYTAHQITIESQNQKAAAIGGTPGMSGGPPQSKTVGSVTVNYDSQITGEKDAGWWNLTTYGKQLYRLIKIFGAQCIQL